MQKHLSPSELQKLIKKDKRRSKKTLFVLIQKELDFVSTFYKEPQLDRKIFIAFDVVINLEIFQQQKEFDCNEIFSDFNVWRVPIKIERRYIPNSSLPAICEKQEDLIQTSHLENIQEHLTQNSSSSSTQSESFSKLSQPSIDQNIIKYNEKYEKNTDLPIINDRFKDNNFLIEIELDTNTTGIKEFKGITNLLKSISEQKANVLADKLNLYQDFVNNCLYNYQLYEKNMTRILPNLKEENYLDFIISEQTMKSNKLAAAIIQNKIQSHKYISYLIKVNKEGQQVIQKFGYSRAFLDIMGIHDNYEHFFMRRGPINPFNPRNRLERLISGLHKKALGYQKKIADRYTDSYQDQEIYTIDNIVFKANYTNEKLFLNQSDQYFIKSSYLLQISTYEISAETEKQINQIRQQNKQFNKTQHIDQEKEIQDLQYNCQSEIFLNKYYVL